MLAELNPAHKSINSIPTNEANPYRTIKECLYFIIINLNKRRSTLQTFFKTKKTIFSSHQKVSSLTYTNIGYRLKSRLYFQQVI
jgi:hypothetical protein